MISEFNLSKKLRDYLKTLTTISVYSPVESYTPQPGVDHILERVIRGETSGPLGDGQEDANGIYQFDVYSKIAAGEFYNLSIVDAIKSGFQKGLIPALQSPTQRLVINFVDVSGVRKSDQGNHLIRSVSVRFRVIG